MTLGSIQRVLVFFLTYFWLCWVFIVLGLLLAVASLVGQELSSCSSRAKLLCSMWDLLRSGIKPTSFMLAGRLPTIGLLGQVLKDFEVRYNLHL